MGLKAKVLYGRRPAWSPMRSSSASSRTAWQRTTAKTVLSWTVSRAPSRRPRLWTLCGVVIDRVIDIEVPDEKIVTTNVRTPCLRKVRRFLPPALQEAGRWKASATNCGGTLVQRKDDHPDTVKDRLHVYHEQTEPLKDYYEKQGKLHIVEGQEEVADTTALTLDSIRGVSMIVLENQPGARYYAGRRKDFAMSIAEAAGEAVEPGVSTWEIDRVVTKYIEKTGRRAQLSRLRRFSGQRLHIGK